MADEQVHDPLNFMRNMWGNMGFSLPGMVAPTFDLDELDKRIKDLKAVEGWLRMNLSMLQMTIQGLEMQRTTVSTVQAMGQMATDAAGKMGESAPAAEEAPPAADAATSAFSGAAMWPWQMMQQMREQMQHSAEAAAQAAQEAPADKPKAPRARK
ncbi:PhaM family polyhydroxyalkanoate granule multifunctional regulatory protein [Azonexus sp.]|uniref:PhaM family polyhydroxyalkanoate granule multifunctional regulatory protein n=1 Tax=Azonexus sp. TaxID=1872668 RepID=UPI0035AFE207